MYCSALDLHPTKKDSIKNIWKNKVGYIPENKPVKQSCKMPNCTGVTFIKCEKTEYVFMSCDNYFLIWTKNFIAKLIYSSFKYLFF